ncbi:hypothetical protein B0O99DRAFT_620021 [Bisporella sp. PMI_857]|nr:hypothetical protein B0O99DRAFT_620021 [Bisporella sp. PMI_857]
MDSASSSLESSNESSSPGPMRLCGYCHKPFLKETSYNRHILYCRRAHNRPRTRVRSCRACSVAKAKCSFQPRCLRCTNKGLDCVYENTTTTRTEQVALGEQTPQGNPPVFSPTPSPSTGNNFTWNDLPASAETIGPSDEAQVTMDWDSLGYAIANSIPQSPRNTMLNFHEPTTKGMPNGTLLLDRPDGRHVIDGLHANFDPGNLSLAKQNQPWPSWPIRDEYFSALSGLTCLSERSDSDFLARVPISDPVSQFTATMVMQMLRAFPQMMLRRETLPCFIHGHWYRPTNNTDPTLPEPLVNCMGIAQVFASQNPDSMPFLWRTVKMEQRSFLEKQKQNQFTKNELLAAVQAQIMYIIMRVIGNSKLEKDLNLELLVTHQILCDSFRKLCNEPFCQDERLYPSSSWEAWIFAESRRRTVLVWFLIAQMVRVKTGVPCDIINGFRALPLCSPKSCWEAKTRSVWQSEYDVYKSMPRMDLDVFGDLIDACKQSDVSHNIMKLDTWNAKADNLGMMLSLSAAMV